MPTVSLELHDTPPGEGSAPRVEIDLDRLTPMARALAESVAARPLSARSTVWLESHQTLRDLFAANAARGLPAHLSNGAFWHSEEELDGPHRIPWCSWSHYPVTSTMDPHDYLEQQAQKLPMGYYPIGSIWDRVPSASAARDDTDLITRTQVLELLRHLGRPITAATMDNYRQRPPADWPQPVRYVGRTPQWSRAAIAAYASQP